MVAVMDVRLASQNKNCLPWTMDGEEKASFCGYFVALLLMLQVVLRDLGGVCCSCRVSALLGEYLLSPLFSSVLPVYHPVQISERHLLISDARVLFLSSRCLF